MKKYSTSNFLGLLLLVIVLASSCSPKYGRHFSPADFTSERREKPVLVAEKESASTLLPEQEQRALAAGATETFSDAQPAPLVAPAKEQTSALAPSGERTELSKKDQRKLLKEFRKKLRSMNETERDALELQMAQKLEAYKASPPPPPGSGASNIDPVLLVIVTILLPPLGVYLYEGEINSKFWISLLLTLLFILPGIIYSLLVIFGEL